jgi:hypothetical protein
MSSRSRRKAMVFLAIPMLAGCEAIAVPSSGGTRLLTAAEMDQVTVGSAGAAIDVAARALPPATSAATLANTLAVSGSSPAGGQPSLNYSDSQLAASATSGQLAGVNGSTHTSVSSANGGASIDATGAGTAAGGPASHAQLSMQFFGFSTSRADLVFGTAVAGACCAPVVGAQVMANGAAGGPYSMQLQGYTRSDTAGQAQSKVDIAVASSATPIAPPGQTIGLLTGRGSPQY